MTTTSRFNVAYRPGKVRAWVVLYRTASGQRPVVARYLTREDAEAAIPSIASNIRQEA